MSNMVERVLNYSIVNADYQTFESIDLNKVLADISNDLELVLPETSAVGVSCPAGDQWSASASQKISGVIADTASTQYSPAPPVS